MTKITLITATVYNADMETESSSTYWDKNCETLEDAIKQCKREAIERFTDDYSNPMHVIVNVNKVPEPEISHTVVESEPDIQPATIEVE